MATRVKVGRMESQGKCVVQAVLASNIKRYSTSVSKDKRDHSGQREDPVRLLSPVHLLEARAPQLPLQMHFDF